jgi:hypothetical protein
MVVSGLVVAGGVVAGAVVAGTVVAGADVGLGTVVMGTVVPVPAPPSLPQAISSSGRATVAARATAAVMFMACV